MSEVLSLNLDIVAFVFVTMLSTALVSLLIRRKNRKSPLPRRMVGVVVLLTGVTIAYTIQSGDRERKRLIEMVSGVAPTYATILHESGLESITVQTSPDDPTYLRLIELQKAFLKANPSVADIYTAARLADGSHVLLVDSETDYDHSGAIDEEREERTDIGEVYEDEVFARDVDLALTGQSVFSPDISTDRWGSWVSAIEPVRNARGEIYGIVGVDFPADRWVSSILSVRGRHLLIGLVVNAIFIIAAYMIAKLQAEVTLREAAELTARASENRLRLIIDNEPECVLVLNRTGQITEVNPAGAALLGGTGGSPLSRRLSEFVVGDRAISLSTDLEQVFAGAPGTFELCIDPPGQSGNHAWLDAHCVPLRDALGQITSVLLVGRDFTARRKAEAEKAELQRQLVDASRQAGMAEIATGVLHNVGNVLNSVNVSVNLIHQRVREMRLASFSKLLDLLRSQRQNLGEFVTSDPRGKCLPDFLEQLHGCLAEDQKIVMGELTQLLTGIEHIKEVVRMQQSCASKGSTVLMPVDPISIMEDAIKVNMVSMERHHVNLTREYEPNLPPLPLDKHKILQILINLISNAKRATCSPDIADRQITVSIRRIDADAALEFCVRDNGVGIDPANLPRLFRHGFTTREDGHGFGLHSSANAATEMSGSLRGQSDGPGTGAAFILTVPLKVASMEKAA